MSLDVIENLNQFVDSSRRVNSGVRRNNPSCCVSNCDMRLTVSRLLLLPLILILSFTSAVSFDGQNRPRRNRKVSSKKVTGENPKGCATDSQTPMPSGTFPCEFGIVDLLCGNCVGGKLTNQP